MGPAYGGAIGSQGCWVPHSPLYYLALYAVVLALPYIVCSQYYRSHSYRYTRYHSTTHMYIPVGSAMCSLCYAVGVLCYATLYCMLRYVLHYPKHSKYHTCATPPGTTGYSITLAMLYVYTEVGG